LPRDILWRQKEQFSDGVGYNWIDSLIATAAAKVTDEMFDMRADIFPGTVLVWFWVLVFSFGFGFGFGFEFSFGFGFRFWFTHLDLVLFIVLI
jgi:hypothetical protein